jgi:hypothetical protein
MNVHQLRFVEHPITNTKLIGCPGAGKSTSLVNKILHHFSRPDQFLMLTFSRRACADFIRKGESRNSAMFSKANVRTIHSLAMSISKGVYNIEHPNVHTVVMAAYCNMIEDEEPAKLQEFEVLKECKTIIVDEAQDVSEIQYKFVVLLAKLLHDIPVIMVGDPNQNIYQFQGGSDKFLMNHPGDMLTLVDNYRSTHEIVEFINPFRIWNNLPPLVAASGAHGPKPAVVVGSVQKIIDHILSEIRAHQEAGKPLESMAIISPVKKCKPVFYNGVQSYTNVGLQLIANHLHRAGIKFVQHYDLSQSDDSGKNGEDIRPDHINLLTGHGSKGLEFDNVLVLNFHLATYGRRPTKEAYDGFRYLWYVTLSRAKHKLTVYVDEKKDAFSTLMNAPLSTYDVVLLDDSKPLKLSLPKCEDDEKLQYAYTITAQIAAMREDALYEFERIAKFEVKTKRMFQMPMEYECHEFKKFATLYGNLAESVLMFYANKSYLTDLRRSVKSIVEVPSNYLPGLFSLFKNIPFTLHQFTLDSLGQFTGKMSASELSLYNYLVNRHNLEKPLRLVIPNIVQVSDTRRVLEICDDLSSLCNTHNAHNTHNDDTSIARVVSGLFDVHLFFYQMEHEAAYLMADAQAFDTHKLMFTPYAKRLRALAASMLKTSNRYTFQQGCQHPNLQLYGRCDVVRNDNTVIEMKFSKDSAPQIKHVVQLLLYHNNLFPHWGCVGGVGCVSAAPTVEIWNICHGLKHVITFSHIDKWRLMCLVSQKLTNGMQYEGLHFAYDVQSADTWTIKEATLGVNVDEGGNRPLRDALVEILRTCKNPKFYNTGGHGSKPLNTIISDKRLADHIHEEEVRDLVHNKKHKDVVNQYIDDLKSVSMKHGKPSKDPRVLSTLNTDALCEVLKKVT